MKKLLLATLFATPIFNYSQDVQYGLVDENALYNNSAFTGTSEQSRFGLTLRSYGQFLSGHHHSTFFYADQYLGKFGSIGLSYSQDLFGDQDLSRDFSLKYAYSFDIGQEGRLNLGTSFGRQTFQFVQPNSVNPLSYIIALSPNRLSTFSNFNLDLGALYYNDKWFASYSTLHINQPHIHLMGVHREQPIRHSAMAGYQFKFGSDWSITPIASFERQGGFTNLTLESRANYKWLSFGLGSANRDQVKAMIGVNLENFRIAYCHHRSISKLSNGFAGNNEISIQYTPKLTSFKNKKPFRLIQ